MAGSTSAVNIPAEARTVRHCLITGASSGLGAALARALAKPGTRLSLLGRDAARLDAVAQACRGLGAIAACKIADVRDSASMQREIEQAFAQAPLDLVIANAGISGATTAPGGRQDIAAVNLIGVMNTIEPLIPLMRDRHAGQIAIIGSLAGFRGMPPAPAYSASKGGVRLYGEALRPLLKKDGIAVSVVCPGFIDTPLTQNNPFPMPLTMTPEKAAGIILAGLSRNRGRIAFPWPIYWSVLLLAALPPSLSDWCLSRLPIKEGR